MSPLQSGLHPDPGTAREWLAKELGSPPYQPSLVERFLRWLDHLVSQSTPGGSGSAVPRWPVLVLVLVLVVVVAFALSRLQGRSRGGETRPAEVFAGERLDAAAHRERARAAYGRGDFDESVVEGMRALTAALAERGIVRDAPDLTVAELTRTGAARFPSYEDRVHGAGRVFEQTLYGGRPADAERAEELLRLDEALTAATPSDAAARGPVAAVPR